MTASDQRRRTPSRPAHARREPIHPVPDTVPPSAEAERATLGALMLSPHAVARLLPVLRDDDFYYWKNQRVYSAIRALHARGRHVDPITVHGQLRHQGQTRFGEHDAGVYLADCLEAAYFPGFAHDYAATVLDEAARRRLLQAGARVTQRASNPAGTPDELLHDALVQLADVRDMILRREALLSPSRSDRGAGVDI